VFSKVKCVFKSEIYIAVLHNIFMEFGILAGLLDDKLIKVISVFMKHPSKKFYLSEISKMSGVNTATTFRILKKLVGQELVHMDVLGKVRVYQLGTSERVKSLSGILKDSNIEKKDLLEEFCEKVGALARVRLILLDSRTHNGARLIIVGDLSSKERIDLICRDFVENKKFIVTYIELRTTQYEGLKSSRAFDMNKKILFQDNSSN